jgi:hypothetical protein
MGLGEAGCGVKLGAGRTVSERDVALGALGAGAGDGVEKVEYEPRLETVRSIWAREVTADAYSVSGDELTPGGEADREGAPIRGELTGVLAVGAGDGVLQTE